jgi:hypothetical protein
VLRQKFLKTGAVCECAPTNFTPSGGTLLFPKLGKPPRRCTNALACPDSRGRSACAESNSASASTSGGCRCPTALLLALCGRRFHLRLLPNTFPNGSLATTIRG